MTHSLFGVLHIFFWGSPCWIFSKGGLSFPIRRFYTFQFTYTRMQLSNGILSTRAKHYKIRSGDTSLQHH